MKSGFDEHAVRGIYYTSLQRDTDAMNDAFAAKAIKIDPKNESIVAFNRAVIKSFLNSNTSLMMEAFREKLMALGNVADPKAAAASQLGRQMSSYCSDYWADVRKRCEDTFAEITPTPPSAAT